MRLIVDGYNLLHAGRLVPQTDPAALQKGREWLIDQLARYRQLKNCEITLVFDGWLGGPAAEKKERRKGIDVIFTKLGETADEAIKRLILGRGSGKIVVSSDRDLGRYAGRMNATVVPSALFLERSEATVSGVDDDVEEGEAKRKGPSKRLSKREKKLRGALKKL